MEEAQHRMEMLVVIWHAKGTQLRPVEVLIGWMSTNTRPRRRDRHQENAVLLTTTITPAQMLNTQISLWDTARFRGAMTGVIFLGA